jgi:hypothetical protein
MLIFIAILAFAQATLGVLRALQCLTSARTCSVRELFYLPFVGMIAFALGALVSVLAMLYLLFAVGMLLQKSWAWWLV